MPTRAPRARTASAISVAVAQQSCSASTETTSSRAAPRRRPEAARAASVCSSQRATLQMITVLTIIAKVLSPFHYAFVQRGAWEVLLLSGAAGLIGTWIVLRGLAFYAHAIGTAAFPGLVVADGLAFSPLLGAFGAAAVFALAVAALGRRSRGYDGSFTALLLVGGQDLVVAALTTVAVVVLSAVLGRRWLAVGFDARNARSLGARSSLSELVLLALVAVSVVAALSTLGALLVSALLVVPAATARLWTTTLRSWQLASVALAAVEGIVGLWVSVEANVPPGAAIAVLAGGAFAIAAVPRAVPALAAVLLLAGCGGGASHPSVVATTTQVADFARAVGGEAVTVHQILQPNTDPHEYEPRPADVQATSDAKVVLENGDKLDDWMRKVVSKAGGHPEVVDLWTSVPVKLRTNPHWWHDPRNAEAAVVAIRDAFSRAFPKQRQSFERNAASYLAQLRALDRTIAQCFANVPPADRKLVTDHDAFPYFAQRYGIKVVGAVIPSQTTQAQPSAGDTAKLIALIKREHVRAVFPESSVNPRLARTIARETGASSNSTLYGDTLGPNQTYLEMERANADAMVRGFTGGRQGC